MSGDLPKHVDYREEADIWRCERCGTDYFSPEKAVLCCPGDDARDELGEQPTKPSALDVEADAVAGELCDREQWVCWRFKWDSDRDEWTKVPIDANTGSHASSTDPETWTRFDEALAYHEREDRDTDGVGFVVHEGDLLVGLDLDDCRDRETGEIEAWAADLVDDVPTYAEVSPSGTGLRLFGFGFLPGDKTRADVDDADGHLEIYETERYLTVTGHLVDDAPGDVQQVNDEIADVHAEHIDDDEQDTETPKAAGDGGLQAGSGGSNPTPEADSSGSLTDEELLDRARDAKNSDKFKRLWRGDTSGYPSHSEADLALAGLLAFWTGGDRRRIDDLFRQSDLYREKWDREDYRERTIEKALEGRTEFYEPGEKSSADSGSVSRPDVDVSADRPLSPLSVMAVAGLGEDDDISDLSDRQKAAAVWELVEESSDVHVCVRRDNGSLWAYAGGVWKPEGERALRHAGRQALSASNYGANVLAELKAQARSDPRVEIDADEFGVETGYLSVENGLVDLETAANGAGEDARRDLRPDDHALTQLPVEYDPNAEYDEWARLVDEWAEAGRADALQEYVGYCLHIGALPIHRALLLVGSGANGKGTFLATVRSLLGRENTTSIELQTLANIDDDLSARKLGAGLGMFKKLIAGDRVRARRLYQDGFEFDAVGKHLYAANEVPKVNVPDGDEAFWRRWLLVEFPNYYPPADRDPELPDRLTEPESLSGVLNWAINGWHRLLEEGHFTNEERLAHDKRERWQAWGDSAEQFVSECVENDPEATRLTTAEAHRRYMAWCREKDLDPVGQQKFTTALKKEDVGYGTSVRVNGSVQRGYKALGLSDDVPDLGDDSRQGRLD